MEIGEPGERRRARVDDDERGPGPLRFADERHQMDAGRRRIRAPDDDELRVRVVGVRDRRHLAVQRLVRRARRGGAQRAGQPRGAEAPEEPGVGRVLRQQAVGPAVAVGEHRLRTPTVAGLAHRVGDASQRLVPADPAERAAPRRADAEARPQQAIGPVHALAEAADLPADVPAGDRVGVAAVEGDHAPVGERHRQAARVRAVERAGRVDLVSAGRLRHDEALARTAWPSCNSRSAWNGPTTTGVPSSTPDTSMSRPPMRPGRDRLEPDRAPVGHEHAGALLAVGAGPDHHRLQRDDEHVLALGGQHLGVARQAGTQARVRVVEADLHAEFARRRAGPGNRQGAGADLHDAPRERDARDGFERHGRRLVERDPQDVRLGDLDLGVDGGEVGNRHQRRAGLALDAHHDHLAFLDRQAGDDAGDGRDDVGLGQHVGDACRIGPGLGDPALRGLAHLLQAPDPGLGAPDLGRRGVGGGRGAVELGHRHEAVLAKVPRPLQLELRLVRAGLRRVEIGLRRLQEVGCRPQVGLGALDPRIRGRRARRRLDGVDARHDLAGLDGVALFHAELDQPAHDTGPDVRIPLGDDLPRRGHEGAEHRLARRGLRVDRHAAAVAARHEDRADDDDAGRGDQPHGSSLHRPHFTTRIRRTPVWTPAARRQDPAAPGRRLSESIRFRMSARVEGLCIHASCSRTCVRSVKRRPRACPRSAAIRCGPALAPSPWRSRWRPSWWW